MGTRWSVICDAPSALDRQGLDRALSLSVFLVDTQMSPWLPNSDLNRLNETPAGVWIELPSEILEVLHCAVDITRRSGGAFDPAVGPLVDAWGFGPVRTLPDAAAIRATTASKVPSAHQALELDLAARCVRKHAPIQLDLCGIAKGYAVDRMIAVLQEYGVRHALAALDGELRALGAQADGVPWAVAVECPETHRRAVHSVIEMEDLAIATSGDYRRCWDIDTTRIAHTMDMRPGTRIGPVSNDVASVSVLARTGMRADAWATALLVAGLRDGLALAQREHLEALWLLRRGDTLVSLGLGRFGTEQNNATEKWSG